MKKKTKLYVVLALIVYGWLWIAAWWGAHLATEWWIAFCQIATIILVSLALLAIAIQYSDKDTLP